MIELAPYLNAYGLATTDLTQEQQNRVRSILLEAGRAGASSILQSVNEVLAAEAAKRGIKTGTVGSDEAARAEQEIQRIEAERAASEAAARRKQALKIGLVTGVLALTTAVAIMVLKQLRKVRA